jgi:hypothetical protein
MFKPTIPSLTPVVEYLEAHRVEIVLEDKPIPRHVSLDLILPSGARRTLTINREFLEASAVDQIRGYLETWDYAGKLEESHQHIDGPLRRM